MKTTLKAIRKHQPCASGWSKLLAHLGKTKADDDPLPLPIILESNGLDDALWALRAVDGHEREMRQFAIDCAARVLKIYEAKHPDDKRPRNAIKAARSYLKGTATMDEMIAAWAAAWAAARAAGDAARDAARAAAGDAGDAARAAARAAAWAAARAAARAAGAAAGDAGDAARAAARAAGDAARAAARAAGAAAWAAGAAGDAAGDAAWAAGDAAGDAERNWQEKRFRKMCAEVEQ